MVNRKSGEDNSVPAPLPRVLSLRSWVIPQCCPLSYDAAKIVIFFGMARGRNTKSDLRPRYLDKVYPM